METAAGSNRYVRFKNFELNLHTGELYRNGLRVKLHGHPIEALAMLLEHPGELVTREALQRRLWPGDTFVDFDQSLNSAINRLREALGDRAEEPGLIETLPRLGYRFIARIEGEKEEAPGPEPQTGGSAFPSESSGGTAGLETTTTQNRSATFWKRVRLDTASGRWLLPTTAIVIGLAAAVVGTNVGDLRDRLFAVFPLKSVVSRPRIESIAVLPFENLSGDSSQEYFADGMTEELITNLGTISGLRVISRASMMHFKGSREPLPAIARDLGGVDALVEGTVARSGNHLRVTANLLRAPTDRQLWANSYDSELEDVLVMESQVARSIADAVRIERTPLEQSQLSSPRKVHPAAYQAYLEGRYYLNKWTEEGFTKAAASYRRSIDLDPTYAPAYDGLADVYCWLALWGLQPATDAFPLAKAAVSKALELDDGLGDAHATLGEIKYVFDWDWAGAEQELKRAVQLSPNSSVAHFNYGEFLTAMGRWDEAVNQTRKALELDPLTPVTNLQLGWVLYYAHRYDESITQLNRTLNLAPDFGYAHMELGWNDAQKRMYPEAVMECQKAVKLNPEEQVTLGACGYVYGLAGRRKEALSLLARMMKLSRRSYLDPYNVALLYCGVGDIDHATEWFERSYRERSASIYGLRNEILPDRVRSDPRFQDLLRRMNFPSLRARTSERKASFQ